MIELALVAGTAIRWQKPNTLSQAQDGAVVASVNGANTMMYLGNTPSKGATAPKGYKMSANTPLPHTWLDYIAGRTAYVDQGTDVVTGFMSGCLIARGTHGGSMRVFHMGTIQNATVTNRVKATFRAQLPRDATGFYPAAAWSIAERANTKKATDIIALVTSGGSFFSILLCHGSSPSDFVVGGIKRVPPLSRSALLAKLA
jgi:hypothetical protein